MNATCQARPVGRWLLVTVHMAHVHGGTGMIASRCVRSDAGYTEDALYYIVRVLSDAALHTAPIPRHIAPDVPGYGLYRYPTDTLLTVGTLGDSESRRYAEPHEKARQGVRGVTWASPPGRNVGDIAPCPWHIPAYGVWEVFV